MQGLTTELMPLLDNVNNTHDLRHWLIVMTVFGITGLSALVFSRLLFNVILGMEGSLWSGPWSYRVLYLSVIPPFYSAMLVLVGSIFGKREYFMSRVLRMWGRLVPGRTRRWLALTFCKGRGRHSSADHPHIT